MSQGLRVAIVGATGLVGRAVLAILESRDFPVSALYFVASQRSEGIVLPFKDSTQAVLALDTFDFSQVDLCFFCVSAELANKYVPKAVVAGAVVIDNSSSFRYQADVPLVVPEVNPLAIADYKARYIIANPNCSTIQMVAALKPIYDAVGIKRVIVSTYQAVSGAGQAGIDALQAGEGDQSNALGHPIWQNVIPQIDCFEDNAYSREEMKMLWETQKILGDEHLLLSATAVRVPVLNGHAEAITIETKQPITVDEATSIWQQAPGLTLSDEPYPMPYTISGRDDVAIGRVRQALCFDHGLAFWVVADNLRKGAALNAVQIAERWLKDGS